MLDFDLSRMKRSKYVLTVTHDVESFENYTHILFTTF
jgi:hypothetical protein